MEEKPPRETERRVCNSMGGFALGHGSAKDSTVVFLSASIVWIMWVGHSGTIGTEFT